MRLWIAGLLVCLIGCTQDAPPPPVPNAPEELSHWSVPELVQPPVPETLPADLPDEKPGPSEKVFDFTPGTTFAVTVASAAPLDIILERGEQLRNLAGGDGGTTEATQTPRWIVKEGGSGEGETFRPHVFLTATEPNLTMGLVMATTKRTYYLTCKSVQTSPIRAVRWRYPQEATPKAPKPKEPGLLPDPTQPMQYHVGYELVGTKPAWQPRQVVDDGKKTYIIYPEVSLFESVPMVRFLGPNGPQLVNSRQYLNVVILDQLLTRAELRVGIGEHAETVTITRGTLRTITCPGDDACPVWPQAAAILARRRS